MADDSGNWTIGAFCASSKLLGAVRAMPFQWWGEWADSENLKFKKSLARPIEHGQRDEGKEKKKASSLKAMAARVAGVGETQDGFDSSDCQGCTVCLSAAVPTKYG